KIVSILMQKQSINENLLLVYMKLLAAEDWDRWVIDSIYGALREVSEQSASDFLQRKDPEKTEAARRRLYFMAYIQRHASKYPVSKLPLNFGNPSFAERARIHDGRVRDVHNIMMNAVRDAVGRNDAHASSVQELAALIPVFENKYKL